MAAAITAATSPAWTSSPPSKRRVSWRSTLVQATATEASATVPAAATSDRNGPAGNLRRKRRESARHAETATASNAPTRSSAARVSVP